MAPLHSQLVSNRLSQSCVHLHVPWCIITNTRSLFNKQAHRWSSKHACHRSTHQVFPCFGVRVFHENERSPKHDLQFLQGVLANLGQLLEQVKRFLQRGTPCENRRGDGAGFRERHCARKYFAVVLEEVLLCNLDVRLAKVGQQNCPQFECFVGLQVPLYWIFLATRATVTTTQFHDCDACQKKRDTGMM